MLKNITSHKRMRGIQLSLVIKNIDLKLTK